MAVLSRGACHATVVGNPAWCGLRERRAGLGLPAQTRPPRQIAAHSACTQF